MRLLHPIPGARISQRFGENPAMYTQYNLAGHEGVDFAAPVGTPVRAAHDGVACAQDRHNIRRAGVVRGRRHHGFTRTCRTCSSTARSRLAR